MPGRSDAIFWDTFGPHLSFRGGRKYIGYSPSSKSVSRIKQEVGELLDRRNGTPWAEVRQELHRKLPSYKGWRQYFSIESTSKAYRAVDEYVYDRVRNFLRRRHKVSSQGMSGLMRGDGKRGDRLGQYPRPSSTPVLRRVSSRPALGRAP
jgi:hypothetical protein